MAEGGRTLRAAGALLLLWALASGSDLAWRLVFVLLGAMAVLWLLLRHQARNLSCSLLLKRSDLRTGEALEVGYDFSNNSWLTIPPCQVEILLGPEVGAVQSDLESYAFSGGEIKSVRRRVTCRHRGIYSVGGVRVCLRDPLGWFQRVRTFDRTVTVKVYPKPYGVTFATESLREDTGGGVLPEVGGADWSRLRRIRPAFPQEPARHVHWKLSARSEELQVMEFDGPGRKGAVIVVDGCRHSYGEDAGRRAEERAVEVAAGLLESARVRGEEPVLVLGGDPEQHLPVRNPEQMEAALQALMGFRPNGTRSVPEMLWGWGLQERGGSLVLVTPELSDPLRAIQADLGAERLRICHVTDQTGAPPEGGVTTVPLGLG